jgi:hypothetical protein
MPKRQSKDISRAELVGMILSLRSTLQDKDKYLNHEDRAVLYATDIDFSPEDMTRLQGMVFLKEKS